jgi:hypothetical protein
MRSAVIAVIGLGLVVLFASLWRAFKSGHSARKRNSLAAYCPPGASGVDSASYYPSPDHHIGHGANHAEHTSHCSPHGLHAPCVDTGGADVGGADVGGFDAGSGGDASP